MKKVYLAPAAEISQMDFESIICSSPVNAVGGSAGITKGKGDAPGTADSRGWFWDDDEEE